MAVTPDTTIKLLKVPIEIDNMNQLTFATLTDQYNYFNGCTKLEEEDLYYQRKDNYILWPAHIDTILQYNYCMYQNSNYSEKWFYAFITNMEYENDGTTKVYIETDVYQSWMFDITMKACFVEREHVNDDTIGKHTIPENLSVGEVVQEGSTIEDSQYDQDLYWICVLTDYQIGENSTGDIGELIHGEQHEGLSVYENVVFGSQICLIMVTQLSDIANLELFIRRTAKDGHPNDIHDIFIAPAGCIKTNDLDPVHTAYFLDNTDPKYTFHWYTLQYSSIPKTFDTEITKLTSYTGVTIRNNKCFVYPYNYIFASNNNGNNNIYKYEDFSTAKCVFNNQMSLSVGCSGRVVPKSYKGMATADDEALPLGKYPTCAWSSDSYTNWLTQNSVNLATSMIDIGAEMTTGIAGNPTGVISATKDIAGLIGDFYKAQLAPNITGGQPTGDIIWTMNRNKITYRQMRAKDEYIKQIDSYFTMYGYKVNEVKIPNVTGRTYWNYVKTIDCNIEGDIPQNDLQKIKDIFNSGVTFWHDPTKFLDYTQSNTIVT